MSKDKPMYKGITATDVKTLAAKLNNLYKSGYIPAQFFPMKDDSIRTLLVQEIPDPRLEKLKRMLDDPNIGPVFDQVFNNLLTYYENQEKNDSSKELL